MVEIAVMGATGTGKSTFINLVSGSSMQVGLGLSSCTSIIEASAPFKVDGIMVTLIDTPGFDDTTKSDAEVLDMIATFLAAMYEEGRNLAGIIYMHRISDPRVGGISRRNFKMFRELCGDTTLRNVVIVTNMWGEVSLQVGEAREAELSSDDVFFKPALEKQAQLLRHTNTFESAQTILRHIIRNHPLTLRIQEELVNQRMQFSETAAAAAADELTREIEEQTRRHEEEIDRILRETEAANRVKDEEKRRIAEEEARRVREETARVKAEVQRLEAARQEEMARHEQDMREKAEADRVSQERAAAEHQRQMDVLVLRIQQEAAAASAEQEAIRQQIEAEAARRSEMERDSGCIIQ